MKKFKNGDVLLYAREAGEEANMQLEVGVFYGIYSKGRVKNAFDESDYDFPIKGILDISDSFDVIDNKTKKEIGL